MLFDPRTSDEHQTVVENQWHNYIKMEQFLSLMPQVCVFTFHWFRKPYVYTVSQYTGDNANLKERPNNTIYISIQVFANQWPESFLKNLLDILI